MFYCLHYENYANIVIIIIMLRRQLSPCSRVVKTKAYEALVRPKLEYASQIWNPNTLKDIKRIEQVQRNAARFVFADYRKTTSVTPLINQLDWDTLHTRRLIHQATMFYRIHYGLVNISPTSLFSTCHTYIQIRPPT